MEEVRLCSSAPPIMTTYTINRLIHSLLSLQNLREEVAMDVDEEEGATVRPKQINNYGVEVDFEVLDDDDREVSA